MFLDLFKTTPDYPFNYYYKSTTQFVSAQSYWLYVLRESKFFVESNWGAVIRPVDIKYDMLTGQVFWIRNQSDRKEIMLQTLSFEGSINELLDSNDGIDPSFVAQCETMGIEIEDKHRKAMSYDEAVKIEKEEYKGFITWVEMGGYFHADKENPKGGYDVSVERLILTSEISESSEPKAIHALELFLQGGSAMERVNSVFAPNEN